MIGLALLKWWYSVGWGEAARRLKRMLGSISASFSVPTLLRTLASPWKQVVAYSGPNQTIGMKFRGLIDNLVSRFVGFTVRILTIFAAGLLGILFGLFGLIGLIVWPFVPLLIPVLLAKGVGLA